VDDDEPVDRLRTRTCSEVCHYLAMQVRKLRQEAEMSQADFAKHAGIPLRTYKRFESRGKANLLTFIEVLRAIDRTHYLPLLFPTGVLTTVPPSMRLKARVAGLRARAALAKEQGKKD
jgi:DNA-binding XRE family transcriptional regulator